MISRPLDGHRRYAWLLEWLLLLAASGYLSPASAELFRWVDAEGKVHYSDRMPAELTGEEHSLLSTDGVELHKIERAKTDEEVRRERELERLRAEQQGMAEQQRAAD